MEASGTSDTSSPSGAASGTPAAAEGSVVPATKRKMTSASLVVSPESYKHYKSADSAGRAAYGRHLKRFPGDKEGANKRNHEVKALWKVECNIMPRSNRGMNHTHVPGDFLGGRGKELMAREGGSLKTHLPAIHADYQKHTQAEQELQELRGLEPPALSPALSPAPGSDHDEQKDDEQKDADDPAVPPGHKVTLLNSL